jgi:UDP-N-acetylmuramate--alanine ligase
MLTENTHFGPERIGEWMKEAKAVFFIGIGGINMSSLAHLTHIEGYRTGGSDKTESALTRRLQSEGIDIKYSHDAGNIEGYDIVVYTVAIPRDNPEYAAANAAGIPLISRADYMGYLMSGYVNRVGISGMHGKSTTTSMCAQIFIDAGVDPTVLSGAELNYMGGAYRIGANKNNFIFEACEYRDSFLDFRPSIAVVLNIEPEHLDYFSGIGHIKDSFVSFVHIASPNGYMVANADDDNVMEVARRSLMGDHVITFGIHNHTAMFRAINIVNNEGCYSFDIVRKDGYLCHVSLAIPGMHNVYNALAAASASYLCGIPAKKIGDGLGAFTGARRRIELIGTLNGANVYSDYAHHPTEIRATLEAIAGMGPGDVVCVFQPHTFSRMATLFGKFTEAFDLAVRVVIADVYSARGTENYGVSSKKLAIAIGEKAEYISSMEKIAEFLKNNIYPGDKLVLMGAGDIEKLIPMLGLKKPD